MMNSEKSYLDSYKELSFFKKIIVLVIILFLLVLISNLALITKINLNTIEFINH